MENLLLVLYALFSVKPPVRKSERLVSKFIVAISNDVCKVYVWIKHLYDGDKNSCILYIRSNDFR